MFVSRGRVWGCRSGTGGNKVCVNAKAVGNDNPGNNSPGITVGITIGSGAVGQGARQELHGLKGAGTHTAAKYSLPGHFQGPGGSAQAQNLAKWSFHVGWEQGKSSVTLAVLLSPSRVNKVSQYQCIYLFPAPFGDL